MKPLHFIGLDVRHPGLGGALDRQFYVNQVGIAVWGVILCSVTSLMNILTGNYSVAQPDKAIERMMRLHGWSHSRSYVAVYLIFFGFFLPIAAFFCVLFFDSLYGWYVFNVRPNNWIALNYFTLIFFFLAGALLVPSVAVIGVYLWKLASSFVGWFGFPRDDK